MVRVALLVACCYPENEDVDQLKGCYNDVKRMKELLLEKLGFEPDNILVLTDKPGSRPRPTGSFIKDTLREMIEEAERGGVVLFYFSGHGTYDQYPDGSRYCTREEGIVPCDGNAIFGADFLEMESAMRKGSDFVLIADSCFSGGLIGPAKEQVGPGFPPDICHVPRSHNLGRGCKSKMMPMASIMHHLQESRPLNLNHHHRPDARAIMRSNFGCDGSVICSSPDARTIMRSNFGCDASIIYSSRYRPCSEQANRAILISGCQSDETAIDVSEIGRRPYGLFTDALCSTLWNLTSPPDNYSLVEMIREELEGQDLQHPCLYCSDKRAGEPFLQLEECD